VFDLNYLDPHDGVSKLLTTLNAIYKSTRRRVSEDMNDHQYRCANLSLVSTWVV